MTSRTEDFSGKIVAVTGASRGIGAVTAAAFALRGAVVIANHPVEEAGQHRAAIEQWRQEAGLGEDRVVPIATDISEAEQVNSMFEGINVRFGGLDILVNNAGINQDRTVAKMTDEQWRRVLQVNLDGTFYCCRGAIPLLRKDGRIINVSSVVAHTGSFGVANYAASKAGLLALTKTLVSAGIGGAEHITVNAVCPGYIDTSMTRAIPGDVIDRVLQRVPLGRKGTAAEIAGCIVFLASESAAYITGQSLGVNGGFYMGD